MTNLFSIYSRDDLDSFETLMLLHLAAGGKLTEYTATGNPVTFETNVAKPLSVVAAFTPVQSGSGDPSPENVRSISGFSSANLWRTGKNLFDEEYPDITSTLAYRPLFVGQGQFTMSCNMPSARYGNLFLLPGNVSTGAITGTNSVDADHSRTTTSVNGYITVAYRSNSDGDPRQYNAQLEIGSTATAYEEYTGQKVSVTFPALGKNLFDKNNVTSGKEWWKGNLSTNANFYASAKIPVIPGEVYNLNRTATGSNTVCYFDENGTYISQQTGATGNITIPSGAYFAAFNVLNGYLDTAMFEKGSTASTYEPYNATAYGGTLDLTTGVLALEWTGISAKLSDCDQKVEYEGINLYRFNDRFLGNVKNNNNQKCSVAKYSWSQQTTLTDHFFGASNVLRLYQLPPVDETTEFTCVCELETPLVYQLTPTEILSLVGDNVLWSDLNGDMTVKYQKKG